MPQLLKFISIFHTPTHPMQGPHDTHPPQARPHPPTLPRSCLPSPFTLPPQEVVKRREESLPGRTSLPSGPWPAEPALPSGPWPAEPAQLSTRTSLPLAPAKPTQLSTVHPHLTHCTHTHPSPLTCRITIKYTTHTSFKTSNWRAKCQ